MRWFRMVLVAVVLAALVGGLSACRTAEEPEKGAGDTPVESGDDEKIAGRAPSLEEFITADTKMADFTLTTIGPDGAVQYEQTGTLWLTPDRFRYDLYEGDTLIRSILTPDGETAYFAQHQDESCEPAVATVENYRAKFDPPPTEAIEDGIDEETGALRMKYNLQKTYTVEGASNSWYQEDIVFLIKDNAVIGIVTRGYVPGDDAGPEDMQTTRRMLTNLQAGVDIPDSTFELPYPVAE